MKNPFKKLDTSGLWIAAIGVSAIAAGVLTWLYFKNKQADDHSTHEEPLYLKVKKGKGKKKKHKSDIEELHEIIPAT